MVYVYQMLHAADILSQCFGNIHDLVDFLIF